MKQALSAYLIPTCHILKGKNNQCNIYTPFIQMNEFKMLSYKKKKKNNTHTIPVVSKEHRQT